MALSIHCVVCIYMRTSGFLYLKLLLNGNSEVLSLGNGFEWGIYAVIDCPSQCLGEQVVSHTKTVQQQKLIHLDR